eukprot:TRINITY_DN70945_c0_g1_i1.p1 TRINITY_DN70945_c0_g1~~TRINITY_DN70945_c0_g1_i1.p1  ORF type:complete len:182 (-),score=30.05 TRINITY_DN70945_c0_g1_i1:192-737(-)
MRKLKTRSRHARKEALGLNQDQSDPSGDEAEADPQPVQGTLEEVTNLAVFEIRSAIRNPDAQAGGVAFIPKRWALRYKHVLGPYKQFLRAHPDKFFLEDNGEGGFIVLDARSVEASPPPKIMTWKKSLNNAWAAYCKVVPKKGRDFGDFLNGLPDTAQQVRAATETAKRPSVKGVRRKRKI